MKLTINDIARKAGVSKSTVSNVINNYLWVPESTKEKVLQVMRDMNYVPDKTARNLAGKKRHQVAVIIDTEQNNYFNDAFFYSILCGAESVLSSADFDISICNRNQLTNEMLFMDRFILNGGVSGLIIPAHILTETIKSRLVKDLFPFVVIGDSKESSIMSVNISNSVGSYLAVELFASKGYRSLAYVGGSFNEIIPSERMNAALKACGQYGIRSCIIKECPDTVSDSYNAMCELLSSSEPPDAVLCNDNFSALGVYTAVREKSLSIPDDVGVITFNTIPIASYLNPPVTAVKIDTFGLGVKAALLLNEMLLSASGIEHIHHDIIPELEITGSVRM